MNARPWLAPVVPLYRLALAGRELRLRSGLEPVRHLHRPVVSIGNLAAGGAGKTPFAIALAQALTRRGVAADILSRGYGRNAAHAARVDPQGHARDYGDEPLLMARATGLPVYVAAQRYQAGLLAQAETPEAAVHILDDAFQHRQLHRDVNILLLSTRDLNDRLLPAGNLREPLSALRRATVVVIPAEEPEVESYLSGQGAPDGRSAAPRWNGPLWRMRRVMQVPSGDEPFLAFCGIARPTQFFAGLEAAGVRLAARAVFPDHHPYTAADMARLAAQARAAGATALLTTEKDRVRLEALPSAGLPVFTAGLRIEMEDEDAALEWLRDRIASA